MIGSKAVCSSCWWHLHTMDKKTLASIFHFKGVVSGGNNILFTLDVKKFMAKTCGCEIYLWSVIKPCILCEKIAYFIIIIVPGLLTRLLLEGRTRPEPEMYLRCASEFWSRILNCKLWLSAKNKDLMQRGRRSKSQIQSSFFYIGELFQVVWISIFHK